jgi:hypothetical protein
MAIIGNIFLIIATLLYFLIISAAYGKPPTQSGDAVGGYAMSSFIFSLVFAGCMAVVAIAVAWKGGFDWISFQRPARYLTVAVGFLAIVIVSALSMALKYEPESQLPFAVRYLTGVAPALFPLVLLIAGVILLNSSLREATPVVVYKIPLALVSGISILACISGIVEWMGYQQKRAAERIVEIQENENRYHQQHLLDIEAIDPTTNLVGLLVFTGRYHDQEVREKALAKIKSNPQWEQELVNLLDSRLYYQVYSFLDANEVDNKTLFPTPLNKSILRMADEIRTSIKKANHLNDWTFDYLGIERMLRSVERFNGLGVDFLPAVREVRAALDEPPQAHLKKVRFTCIPALDRWLKKQI